MQQVIDPFSRSAFCWAENLPAARNQFVSFERKFSLSAVTPATLHLFADTRYRLWVNETFVAYGPGRFVTSHPEYDTHDLTPLLRRGENTLRVEVNYYGCSSYQTMPDGLPGFIAAGGSNDGAIDFSTPGAWHALIHKAWNDQAPHFSFAQNPAEICDTRILAAELASPAAHPVSALPASATPWAKPVPRSTTCPDYALVRPAQVLTTGPLENVLRWGMQITAPVKQKPDGQRPGVHLAFSTWIHSPCDQNVTLDCFWADLQLNGQPVTITYPARLGNHGQADVTLRSGWNFLAGSFEILLDYWSFMLGLPTKSKASLHALPDTACRETFAVSSFVHGRIMPPNSTTTENYTLPQGWKTLPSDLESLTPARLTGWDAPASATVKRDIPMAQFSSVATHHAHAALWSLDFGDEYYGQPVIEVEAPAGSILDIAYDDWKRGDGCVNLYNSNPFTDAADRFILRGGRQRIEVLNPRGGYYLQIVLRVPAGSAAADLTVHDVAIRRRTLIKRIEGTFSCGDPVLDWTWNSSIHTLQASTDEGYADCPWRERGSYIGDGLVNFHLHRLATNDLSAGIRTFNLFGQAQLPDGQLAGCAPSWLRKPHEDFTLIWIQAVRDIWAHTGNSDFAATQWPIIQRIWSSKNWKPNADGLWDTTGQRVFLDWGVLKTEREGAGNAAVNILRVAAARACAELASALKLPAEVQRFTKEADDVSAALCARVWNESEGRFNASIGASTPAVHANVLALRYGVGPSDRILAYLEPLLKSNFKRGIEIGQGGGFVELYFHHYLLPALVAHDRVTLAETLIQETYGFLKSLNHRTLTECFHRAHKGQGSCCHSWSGAPAIYATEYILGLRLAKPGDPDTFVLDPISPAHAKAEGKLPHRCGVIEVQWERQGGRIKARVTSPKGVTLIPAAHVDLVRE